jgi:hypothetical protein
MSGVSEQKPLYGGVFHDSVHPLCNEAKLHADDLDPSMLADAVEKLEPYMWWHQSRWRNERIIKTWGVLCGRLETSLS